MRRKWLLIAGAAIIIGSGAAGTWAWRRNQTKRPTTPVQQAQTAPLPPGAEVVLSGKVLAQHVIEVPASIEGTVDVFHVDVGQEVYEGQLLATIKNTKLETARDMALHQYEAAQGRVAAVDGNIISAKLEASRASAEASRARSEYDRLKKAFERQQMLQKEGATPRVVFERAQKDFDAATAEYESARDMAKAADEKVSALSKEAELARKIVDAQQQELDQAKAELASTEVHSPVDGIVLARKGEPGSEVTRDTKDLFQIATDLSSLGVTLEPEPPILQRLEPGMPALVFVTETSDTLPGQIAAIKGTQVTVQFQSPSITIKPGLTAQVRLRIK